PREETYDQIRSKLIDVEVIPSNGPATAPPAGTAEGFGNSMGLAVFGGEIDLVYAGNLNTNLGGGTPDLRVPMWGLQLRTQEMTIASGPRVIDGDMGAIYDEATIITKVWSANLGDVVD